ncbi:uncharacterized protein LOC116121941 [Pistacia vera]|uniref:uncharacterized protein LOC116121941 n=1 Tax=Pistacia vera TaxID=55513 RepID=UPI001262FD76|nr:uncharacterized protein LOC116121941 [Pistacia vera]
MLHGSAFFASSPASYKLFSFSFSFFLKTSFTLTLSYPLLNTTTSILLLLSFSLRLSHSWSKLFGHNLVLSLKKFFLLDMGKEWYWGGNRSTTNSKRGVAEKDTSTSAATPSGCMSAVFQFFDFHHFQFPLHQHQPAFKPDSFIPEDHTILKGVEAPRNSLELEEPPLSSTSCFKEEENLNISMGIQIKTRKGDTRSKVGSAPTDSSSEISSSPGAKTPNLVARLMGLDLLPDSHSPSSTSFHGTPNLLAKSNLHRPRQPPQNKPTTCHRNSIDGHITGTRSLPETPRISSARRSDVDHHRLSLQINKENMGVGEEFDFSRFSYLRRKELKQEDEYRSPSHYARQIVKQVKESVSRKVGLDITNTLKNREQARDELVSKIKAKKISSRAALAIVDQSSPGNHPTPSCSPRLSRFLESKQKPTTPSSILKDHNHIPHQPRKQSCAPSSQTNNNNQPQPIKVLLSKPKLQPVQEQQNEQRPAKKCKKAPSERFSPRLRKPPQTSDIIRNKQEEPFVRPSTANRANNPDKKCKKTPLSNELLNITVPTLLPVKKDPSPPATKIPQKQVLNAQSSKRSSQLSNNSSQTYKQEATHRLIARDTIDDRANSVTNTTVGGASEYEYEYITRILKRTGIDKHTPVSFIHWFSPSHPLNPSIFHHLENNVNTHHHHHQSLLSHQCNRKLLFYLADEILVDILKPFINMKPWITSHDNGSHNMHMQGSELIEKLCLQIKSFPCADCRVLEDIDSIIEKDLPQMKELNGLAFEEEGEGLVMEIEKDILDTLIQETAVEFGIIRS